MIVLVKYKYFNEDELLKWLVASTMSISGMSISQCTTILTHIQKNDFWDNVIKSGILSIADDLGYTLPEWN